MVLMFTLPGKRSPMVVTMTVEPAAWSLRKLAVKSFWVTDVTRTFSWLAPLASPTMTVLPAWMLQGPRLGAMPFMAAGVAVLLLPALMPADRVVVTGIMPEARLRVSTNSNKRYRRALLPEAIF